MGEIRILPVSGNMNAQQILREHGLEDPPPDTKVFKCKVSVPISDRLPSEPIEGDLLTEYWEAIAAKTTAFLEVLAWAWGDYVFVSGGDDATYLNFWRRDNPAPVTEEAADPFIQITPLSVPFHKTVKGTEYRNDGYRRTPYEVQKIDSYGETYDYVTSRYNSGSPWNYLKMRVTVGSASSDVELRFHRPDAGLLDLNAISENSLQFKASINLFGLRLSWEENIELQRNTGRYAEEYQRKAVMRLLQKFEIVQGKAALWTRFLTSQGTRIKDDKGVKAAENKKGVKENLARLATDEPLLYTFFGWLHESKTKDGTSNNVLLAAFLTAVGADYEALKKGLREAMDQAPGTKTTNYSRKGRRGYYSYNYSSEKSERDICLDLPGAKEKNEEKRAQKEWILRKGAREQAIGLGVSPDAHPLLLAAIEANEIPLSLFHKHGDELSLVNVEFDLWERAFAQPGWKEVLVDISKNASRRSTYDKDITPYIAFLFRLPKYLDRHTEAGGTPWKAMPKFVQGEWELEMNEAEGETTKRRSALTPVADNKTRVVTVPYIAMAIHGIQTTYCYALDFQVFEENDIDRESKSVITRELEIKLNGRDDYGLMYYTLTGTPRNTGYPTFLIIFERMKSRGKTRVHFHRVHPCRSKNGKPTPACRLVEECYRYMAGNVRAEEIHAQQGDLIFIKTDQKIDVPEDAKNVKEFESHAFVPLEESKPIKLVDNTNKSIKNRLGFLVTEGVFSVRHPEHENIKALPAGIYDVRRCKSWEANPKAVWVLTID